ncbi:ATP-binding protein [Streptomyces sp. MNU76]|uniref:SCO6881 family protein n=1 Tax=Streptomyces sp. MNU76 TaxID=2560026 RepID=UPI001E43FF2D|nr:ATP-binding protein [Streptomyces sp. MNU76]MCC9707095.1 ATP-binding protein [Streptomyces sp. MNU76]
MNVCELPLMSSVCDSVTSGVGDAITDGIGAWIAKSTGELAASAADLAAEGINATTTVNLNASWFRDNYELLLPIGLILTIGTFCLALIRAAWRRDSESLFDALKGTIVGIFFAFTAIAFTTVALTVVDALSEGLFTLAKSSISDAIRRVVLVSQFGQLGGLGWLVQAMVALGAAIGAFMYWGVMVFRKVGILILVTLAVFAGAGGGWEVAKRWRRGWIEATATLVVSKLLMTIVFLTGVSAMGKADAKDGLSALSDAMAGIVVLALVMLTPYATYKFVHWAADGAGGEDLHRSGSSGVVTAARGAKTAGQLAVQAGTGTPAPQGPASVPGMGSGGVASGIDPTGGSSSTPKQVRFRYGEDPNASGDKGTPLIKRPPTDGDRGQPLIRRPGQQTAANTPAASGSAAAEAPTGPQPQGSPTPLRPPAASGGAASSGTGPSPQGSATPQQWVYPNPPGGSRS